MATTLHTGLVTKPKNQSAESRSLPANDKTRFALDFGKRVYSEATATVYPQIEDSKHKKDERHRAAKQNHKYLCWRILCGQVQALGQQGKHGERKIRSKHDSRRIQQQRKPANRSSLIQQHRTDRKR